MNRKEFLSNTAIGTFVAATLPYAGVSGAHSEKPKVKPFTILPKGPLDAGPSNVEVRTIIKSAQTNGQFSNVEVVLGPRKMGPSPHTHKNLDELMFVLEGTGTVMIGEEIHEVPAGGWNFRPRRIPHSFWNASDQPLRFIDCFFNQNLEDYLDELFHDIIPAMVKGNLTPTTPEIASRIAALDKKFGITWFHERRQTIIDKYSLTS